MKTFKSDQTKYLSGEGEVKYLSGNNLFFIPK